MIEKMKKVTLLVSQKDRDRFIAGLREAGVLHVRRVEEPVSHDITFLDDRISRIERLMEILTPYSAEESAGENVCDDRKFLEIEQRVSEIFAEKGKLEEAVRGLRREIEWFGAWGEFDPIDLSVLRENGVDIRLFRVSPKDFRRLSAETEYKILGKTKRHVLLAVFGRENEPGITAEECAPPEHSPDFMRKQIAAKEKRIRQIEEELREKAAGLERIKACRAHLEKERGFQVVKHGMGEEERFAYLQGYCPAKVLDQVKFLAEKENAGYVAEDPENPDETPTLITNPKWIDIIRPVFQFMNTLPGYNEFDISGVFLVFFSLFFAMLVGDAGYGLVFILITFFARKKAPKAPPQSFFLMYLMGASTVVWGALTGTWFGAKAIAALPGVNALVIDRISSFGDTQDFLIYFCFIIGAVQLTIAHLLRFFREINSPRSVAQIGWISIVWGMFFAAGTLVVKKPFPAAGGWLLLGGISLVLVFNEFQKNFLKGIGSTLTSLPLNVISAFSDVVSYLRLFAVGYATVVLAGTFNNMALGGGVDGVLGGISAAFILFLGHALNILLALMAVIVHGIRLNMLEFSANHMGMQWSGKKYKPFSEEA